jgi:DnaJ-class molecular chaperone
MENIVNYYQILDVPYHATSDEIKEAYRKKVKSYHPDKENGNAELFKTIKEAYEFLRNSEKRKAYDNIFFSKTYNRPQPPQPPSNTTVIRIKGRSRKKVFLSSLTINAAIILIGILAKKR